MKKRELAITRALVSFALGGSGLLACVQLLRVLNQQQKERNR